MRPKRWQLIQDIDGCLANFNDPFLELLQDMHGPPPKGPMNLTCWHWPQDECGYTDEQVNAAWDVVDELWWQRLNPLPGAVKALDKLYWLEHEGLLSVTFVTGRHPWVRKATQRWLDEMGYGLGANVLCTSVKGLVARALGPNGPVAAIEDKPSIINEYPHAKVSPIYVIDAPYNRHNISGTHIRVPDVLTAIMDLENLLRTEKAPAETEASEAV